MHSTAETFHLDHRLQNSSPQTRCRGGTFLFGTLLFCSCQCLKIENLNIKPQISRLLWLTPTWNLPEQPDEQFPRSSRLLCFLKSAHFTPSHCQPGPYGCPCLQTLSWTKGSGARQCRRCSLPHLHPHVQVAAVHAAPSSLQRCRDGYFIS